jgi:hypothetical protein
MSISGVTTNRAGHFVQILARALGLTIPVDVLSLADEVIE